MSKLSIGTVQFGLSYGIANQAGKINKDEVKKILQLAKNSNILSIDTAISYGDSEKIIGELGVNDFQIVSKLPDLPHGCDDIYTWVERNVKSSINRLRISSLYGLLIHNSENILGSNGLKLINALKMIKLRGLVKKIGISIYDPNECEKVMKIFEFDIIQAPLNIIDRRFVTSGWLSRLHSEGVEIHTRSVFLQGLLLMPRSRIPKIFDKWNEIWDQWFLNLKKNNISALEACLSYPLSLPQIDKLVIGVDNVTQLKDIILKTKSKKSKIDWSFMISTDQMLINPTNWKK